MVQRASFAPRSGAESLTIPRSMKEFQGLGISRLFGCCLLEWRRLSQGPQMRKEAIPLLCGHQRKHPLTDGHFEAPQVRDQNRPSLHHRAGYLPVQHEPERDIPISKVFPENAT